MRIIICGAGQVGFGIAERLAAEQHDVSVIDTSPALVAAIRESLDVRAFVGNGAHPHVLAAAGAAEADMIVAVTLYDEVNVVACEVAQALFSIPTKVARIRSQSYLEPKWNLFSREKLSIDVVISPEIEVGDMVLRRLAYPGATDIVRFADDRVVMAGLLCKEDCPVVDTPLRQLSDLFPGLGAVVVGIQRGNRLFVPHSGDQMQTDDLVYVVTAKAGVKRLMKLFGHDEPEAARVVIAGGGNIGLFVASRLEQTGRSRVSLIEASRTRAMEIADDLPRTVTINGSALDIKMLKEADIEVADVMVAVTNDDKVNLLSCVMARELGAKRNLALLNDTSYPPFARALGIDAFLNPRAVTVSKILRLVRRGRIRGVHSIQNGAAEILEAEALETSPLVGRPLREIDLPDGLRIGAVVRKDAVISPNGETRIMAHDRVIIFALAERVRQVEQMFRVSLEFF